MGLLCVRACIYSLLLLCLSDARRVVPSLVESVPSDHVSETFFEEEAVLKDATGTRRLGKKSSSDPSSSSLSANDRLVRNLPGLDAKTYQHRHWAGYVDVAPKGHLFYWLFEAWESPSTAPLVVWFNGGPGCTSMDGLFIENGPFRIGADQSLSVNPHAWAAVANVVYIDQPVGTGLSYTASNSYPKSDGEINKALLEFFNGFFAIHQDLAGREMFLTGESHAGHYLPSLAQALLLRNDKKPAEQSLHGGVDFERVNLGGVAIGNGWFDPRTQYDVSGFAHGQGLISAGQARALKEREKTCQHKLDRGTYMVGECWDLLDDVVAQTGALGKSKALMYDVRSYAKSTNAFPPNHDRVEKYLNTKAVRQALHAGHCPLVFKECTDPPYNALKHQDGLGVTREVSFLLDRRLPLLFFNGQYDLICNHVGVEAALDALVWSGRDAFAAATPDVWTAQGSDKPAGYARSAGSLTLLLVLGSGHMVPMDKPNEALDMLRRFTQHKPLGESNGKRQSKVKPRAAPVSSDKLDTANLLPPVIREEPTPGDGAAAVSFEHNPTRLLSLPAESSAAEGEQEEGRKWSKEEDGERSGGERVLRSTFTSLMSPKHGVGTAASSEQQQRVAAEGSFVVTSSPEGLSARGSASPIVVAGLTNGRAYTFSVVAEVHDQVKNQVRRSLPSAGSSAVVPGCGAALSDALLASAGLLVSAAQAPPPPRERGVAGVSGDGGGSGGGGGGDQGDSDLFSALSAGVQVSGGGCVHGVCALPTTTTTTTGSENTSSLARGGRSLSSSSTSHCFCDAGFTGKDCSILVSRS